MLNILILHNSVLRFDFFVKISPKIDLAKAFFVLKHPIDLRQGSQTLHCSQAGREGSFRHGRHIVHCSHFDSAHSPRRQDEQPRQ